MQILRVPTSNGIDDIKLIGETELERVFIKQLAEAGTLSSISRQVGSSVIFRPVSVGQQFGSGYGSSQMSIGKYDFEVRQNQEKLFDLSFNNNATPQTPLDLSIYTGIKIQVKKCKGGAMIFELTLGSGLQVIGADNNILSVVMTADQTRMLTGAQYYYDVLMSQPTSNVYYLEGKITVKTTATR